MSKMDATKYLRQMKYLPDISPLCNIILIIVVFVCVCSPMSILYNYLGTPPGSLKMNYAHYQLLEPMGPDYVSLVILKSGEVTFYTGRKSFRLDEFKKIFLKDLENGLIANPKKIRIYAEADVSWGVITDVLRFAKEMKIPVAGFMMEGVYNTLHYWEMEDRYREKGLKAPLGNQ